jgi:hypothetical protein
MLQVLWAVQLEAAFCINMGYKQSPVMSKPNHGLLGKIRGRWLGRYLVEVEAMRLGVSVSRLRAMHAASRPVKVRKRPQGTLL